MPEHGPFSAAERPTGAEAVATLVGELLLSPWPPAECSGKVGGPGARRDGKAVGGAPVRLRGCEASGIFAAVFSWAGPGWSRRPGEKLPQAERAGAGGGPTGGNSAD